MTRKAGPEPKRYLFRGERRTVLEIMAITGFCDKTVRSRVSGDRVLEGADLVGPWREPNTALFVTYDGETRCVAEWARIVGISENTLYWRITAGWSPEQALTTPPKVMGRHPRIRNRRVIRRIASAFHEARP